MPQGVRYRTTLRRLLERVMGDGAEKVASINIAKLSENSGVPRATLYYWMDADTDNPDDWLIRYDPEIERRLRLFFSELFNEEDVQVIERMENSPSPKLQEMAILTV
jgi:hypothetical protein